MVSFAQGWKRYAATTIPMRSPSFAIGTRFRQHTGDSMKVRCLVPLRAPARASRAAHRITAQEEEGADAPPDKRGKVIVTIEAQAAACRQTIAKLKGEMQDRHGALQRAQAELSALVTCLDALRALALPAPASDFFSSAQATAQAAASGQPFRIGAGTPMEKRHVP